MLSPSDDLDLVGDLGASRTVLIPDPAPLAPVNDLEAVAADSVRNLCDCSIAGVGIRCNVSTVTV